MADDPFSDLAAAEGGDPDDAEPEDVEAAVSGTDADGDAEDERASGSNPDSSGGDTGGGHGTFVAAGVTERTKDQDRLVADLVPQNGGVDPRVPVPDDPAFEYDDVDQVPVYARTGDWDQFRLALEEARIVLGREYGISGEVPKRELHAAALRVIGDSGIAIAEEVVAERQT